jgi:hypothetical protein
MRQRFVQVLENDDSDAVSADVLHRFWVRAKPLPVRFEKRAHARVIDLATWAQRHDADR